MTSKAEIKAQLLGETARCPFTELQRFFAQGCVIRVAEELDLLDVGVALAEDDATQIEGWKNSGQVALLEDAIAQSWLADDVTLWTVVIKPWVVVQHRTDA